MKSPVAVLRAAIHDVRASTVAWSRCTLLENLEQRRLLSAVTVTGDGTDESILIRVDDDIVNVEFLRNGNVVASEPLNTLSGITVNGAGGNDRLTLDLRFANFVAGGISFDAGTGTNAVHIMGLAGNGIVALAGSDVTLESDTLLATNNLSFNVTGGKLTVANSQQMQSMTVGTNATVALKAGAGTALVTRSLVIAGTTGAWTGKLDIGDNALVIDYTGNTPRGDVLSQLSTAINGGHWSGFGIQSSVVDQVSAVTGWYVMGIGEAEASDLSLNQFVGLPVDGTAVILRYTHVGDADLDGDVDAADQTLLNSRQGLNRTGWSDGNFNYDNRVSSDDWSWYSLSVAVTPRLTPSHVTAVAVSPSLVRVAWKDNSSAETSFVVQRRVHGSGAAWDTVGTTSANAVVFDDDDPVLAPDTAYDYQVLAQNAGGSSAAAAAAAAAITPSAFTSSAAPGNLTGSYDGGQLTLSWSHDYSANGYNIERLQYAGTDPVWILIGTTKRRKFLVGNSGGINSYRVRAISNGKDSVPLRTTPASISTAEGLAVDLLGREEAKHGSQPYYDDDLRELFDRLALALGGVGIQFDDGLPSSARYYEVENIIRIRHAATALDVVHELVHAVDDIHSWHINQTGYTLDTSPQEALAYAVEYTLRHLADANNPRSLAYFTTKTFANGAAAQTAWDNAWNYVNKTLAETVYYVIQPFNRDRNRRLAAADISDMFTRFSWKPQASVLLARYNAFLSKDGPPVGVLNNTFTFALDPVFI